jgi:hypothetical protein
MRARFFTGIVVLRQRHTGLVSLFRKFDRELAGMSGRPDSGLQWLYSRFRGGLN